MRCNSMAKLFALFFALISLSSLGGVFATWIYCGDVMTPQNDSWGVDLSEFVWAPEEILPVTPGSNYMVLLDSILNNDKGGLNSSKGTVKKAVKQYSVVHSSQNVQGGNLKHLFITEECKELDFIIEYVNDSEYHVYMFENKDALAGLVNVTQIYAYKTIMTIVDGEWIGLESQLGYSTLRYVRDTSYVAISPSEWIHGSLPVS